MKLKELRIEKGLTQKEVAKYLNIGHAAYNHYETGRSEPSIEMLIKLADYFHTTIDGLLGHNVPYLLDKSLLTKEQSDLVEKVSVLTKDQCMLVNGFIEGIKNKK